MTDSPQIPVAPTSPPKSRLWADLPLIAKLSAIFGTAMIALGLLVVFGFSDTAESSSPINGVQQVEGLSQQAIPLGDSPARACLGGWADMNKAIIEAQKAAPITQAGAAEFAATYRRFVHEYRGMVSDLAPIGNQLLASNANDRAKRLLADPESTIDMDLGYSVTTDIAGQSYTTEVLSDSPPVVRVQSSMSINFSAPGRTTKNQVLSGTVDLVAVDGHWRILNSYSGTGEDGDLDTPSVAHISSNGTAFEGVCD